MSDSTHRHGLLFLLIGPPGAGKNAIMNDALGRTANLRQLATATTRPMRPNEAPGREHLFVTIEDFQKMVGENLLLEWQQVHGNLYGIPRQTVESAFANGEDLTADIDVLGATYLRSLYPEHVILVFIKPPSLAELEARMRTRGESEEAIAVRMKRVEMEMTYAPLCDHIILNENLAQAASEFNAIISAERQRRINGEGPIRHYEHVATLIPVYGGEVLRSRTQGFLSAPVRNGDLPHRVALELAAQRLGLEAAFQGLLTAAPHRGSFVPPVTVHIVQQGETHIIDFAYLYLLPTRINAPEGWVWTAYDQAGLEQSVLEVLHEQLIPGD